MYVKVYLIFFSIYNRKFFLFKLLLTMRALQLIFILSLVLSFVTMSNGWWSRRRRSRCRHWYNKLGWYLKGSDRGCCGNYSGCCKLASITCLIHDNVCKCCDKWHCGWACKKHSSCGK